MPKRGIEALAASASALVMKEIEGYQALVHFFAAPR